MLADIITADLKGLLRRLTGLETLAFNDGTPFADEVTLNWINQSVLDDMSGWDEPVSAISTVITIFWRLNLKHWRSRQKDWMPHSTGCRHARAPTPQKTDGCCVC